MANGIGGSTAQEQLNRFSDMTADVTPIAKAEFEARLEKARGLLGEQELDAVYFHAGTTLYYFTGTQWTPSERMVGAILTRDGRLAYIGPGFERGTIQNFMLAEGPVYTWEEHEDPCALFGEVLAKAGVTAGRIGLDETLPLFLTEGLAAANPHLEFCNGRSVISACRACKSDAEIAILKQAKAITMEVIKAAARILRPGIPAQEVADFMHEAHIAAGVPTGNYFSIVLFGEDSQYPHGVPAPQPLVDNDIVLLDVGCQLHGYISDITRTFVYGVPTERHRQIWDLEKATQLAAFAAAQIGASCSAVDDAARAVLRGAGMGPDYELPGCPHRTGHGTGLDIHERPYMVRGNDTPLQKGMVASIEPMICMPGEFGIRHEDHFYMTAAGARWFTEPMRSIDDPFGFGD